MSTEIEAGLVPRGRKPFQQLDYSALDRDTIEAALINMVKAQFPSQKDFVTSAGFSIITREIAYVADLLSYRADYLANNNYLPSATNLRALDNLLSLIGYQRSGVQPASADVVIVPKTTVGNPDVPAEASLVVRIPAKTVISGVGSLGTPVSFELFASSSNIFDDIEIAAGKANVIAYALEGISKSVSVKSNGERFQQILLPDQSIILDTIRVNAGVYDPTDTNAGSTYNPNLPEWEKVDYIVIHREENIFEVRLRPDGITMISFGDGTFGNVIPANQDVIINYRTGGGQNGNVLPQGLNGSGNFPIFNGGMRTPDSMSCAMTNSSRGVGGRDEESLEEAKFLAPLVYQAQNRAVKDIDYTAFALNHPKISKAVAVSRQQIVVDAYEEPTIWSFPLAASQNYTISLDIHNFETRTTQNYFANLKLPAVSYTDIDTLIFDLNAALGWTYDPETLAFHQTELNKGFIAHFDKSIEGFIELWIETGTYQARATLKESGNSVIPIVRMALGSYGRVDANYVDIYTLTYAEDGTVAVPNAALTNELRTYFEQYKEIQTEVVIRRGFIQRVDITGDVFLDPTADPIQVKNKINSAILGLFEASNRELGEPFYISKLFESIEAVAGVAYVDEFSPAQNVFPDKMTLIQLGNLNVTFYEAK